ncbi:MAG TPA: dTDP-4-dehydrorhamnose 3,5-epimerase family protein [Vicinamibacterales bacterium]|jgi:dTDP-4-dehydrorhamnose 3,5-epimerase|nr:dTDP-4-dehydrorhamnose 3,5-epimerase family protein [Vicinamibacterales bacterium]
MIFREARLPGVFEIDLDGREDDRGFFARSYCWREFTEHGLDARFVQCNISYNRVHGTLRGMHYQEAPHGEAKLIRCSRGALYDVVIDLRPESRTYRQWQAIELTATPGRPSRMLYVPERFAHGFLTLADDTEVFYQMSEFYAPDAARGLRWNDPAFAIEWPGPVRVISERDRTYPDFIGKASEVRA